VGPKIFQSLHLPYHHDNTTTATAATTTTTANNTNKNKKIIIITRVMCIYDSTQVSKENFSLGG
jgi:hypothetical protein